MFGIKSWKTLKGQKKRIVRTIINHLNRLEIPHKVKVKGKEIQIIYDNCNTHYMEYVVDDCHITLYRFHKITYGYRSIVERRCIRETYEKIKENRDGQTFLENHPKRNA